MKWKRPPDIKIYEALGAVADNRVHVDGNSGLVTSSNGDKQYTVCFDFQKHAIMSNDNGSYWKGYLGYPSIALLMKIGVLHYREDLGNLMQGIAWKKINTTFNNNFEKTLDHILKDFSSDTIKSLELFVEAAQKQIALLDLQLLGERKIPPNE